MTLLRRIHRLESIRVVEPCSVCGGCDASGKLVIEMAGHDSPSDTPEFCPGCGRRQVLTLEFDKPGDDP